MKFTLHLSRRPLLAGTCFLLAAGLLLIAIASTTTVGILADRRGAVDPQALAAAVARFDNSSRLHARYSESLRDAFDFDGAEFHARRAIQLSPHNFQYHMLLASIKESTGDLSGAEMSMMTALDLAPHNTDSRWQLANLLLRQGLIEKAADEFRIVCAADHKLLPLSLNTISRATEGRLDLIERVTGAEPEARMQLALLLLKQSETEKAAEIFLRIDRQARLADATTPTILNAFLTSGRVALARKVWASTLSEAPNNFLVSNGSFESAPVKGLTQFDWNLADSAYAKTSVASSVSRTGERSLKLEFTGRDTTRLGDEARQLIVVRSGARYRLTCFAKAEFLVSSQSPRVAIKTTSPQALLAETAPVSADESGWQELTLEFTAPSSESGKDVILLITIIRQPQLAYDAPTRGAIWFDDFTLIEADSNP